METIQERAVCCLVPQHILRNIADHGEGGAPGHAAATLKHMDAITGQRQSVAARLIAENAQGRKWVIVSTAAGRRVTPGRVVLDTSKPSLTTRDAAARQAFGISGETWSFYRRNFNRESTDGQGAVIRDTVHYGKNFDNAVWDGQQTLYGDGDSIYFNPFTGLYEVACHELTHAVTQADMKLVYEGQSGALNEHFSDVMGISFKQWMLHQNAEASDWLIGAGLFTPRVHGVAIRSMKQPGSGYDDPVLGRDPQPDHMSRYIVTADDNGGVHINSGIPNRAFYIASVEYGGPTWNGTALVWYESRKLLSPRASFIDMARATTQTAGVLFGTGSNMQVAVAMGWSEVGLPVSIPAQPRLKIGAPRPADDDEKWRTLPKAAARKKTTTTERTTS
jgi:Zn-dependent metalloprotease